MAVDIAAAAAQLRRAVDSYAYGLGDHRAAGKALVYSLTGDHAAAGTLGAVVTHPNAQQLNAGGSLLWMAAFTGDIDLVTLLTRAGAARFLAPRSSIYWQLLHAPAITRADGSAASDDDIAACLTVLREAGAGRGAAEEPNAPCAAALECARHGRRACLRVMMDMVEGTSQVSPSGQSLLHAAAGGAHASLCAHLMKTGGCVTLTNASGHTPFSACLTSSAVRTLAAVCDTIDVLLAVDDGDAHASVHNSAIMALNNKYEYAHAVVVNEVMARVCMAIAAAVRTLPRLRSVHVASLHLDECSNTFYLADALRVGSDTTRALRLAARTDAALGERALPAWACPHASQTLSSWAWMRRVHALLVRRRILGPDRVATYDDWPIGSDVWS